MANLLTAGLAYNPYFYVNEGLRILYKRLGMAFYVQRDLAGNKGSGTGDTVQVRRAQSFATAAMPIAEASFADVSPNYDNLVIDQWRGQGFKLTDKEKTLTPAAFIRDHIAPVANAIADRIDSDLASLTLECPWEIVADGTNPYKDFPAGRKMLLDNKAPVVNAAEYSYMTDSVLQARYETDPTFVQAQSDAAAGELQRSGTLGAKFGFRVFPNQNATSYTSGTGALTSPVATPILGAKELTITGTSGSGTLKRGTILTVTGDPQKYAVKTDIVVGSTGPATPVQIVPNVALTQGSVAVSFGQTSRTSIGLMFHREALALVMQPLEPAGPGILTATVQDEVTGLTLRSRIWGSGGLGATIWALDALWGYKTLNPNLAVRIAI